MKFKIFNNIVFFKFKNENNIQKSIAYLLEKSELSILSFTETIQKQWNTKIKKKIKKSFNNEI